MGDHSSTVYEDGGFEELHNQIDATLPALAEDLKDNYDDEVLDYSPLVDLPESENSRINPYIRHEIYYRDSRIPFSKHYLSHTDLRFIARCLKTGNYLESLPDYIRHELALILEVALVTCLPLEILYQLNFTYASFSNAGSLTITPDLRFKYIYLKDLEQSECFEKLGAF